MFGHFHICSEFLRVEKERAVLTGVEIIRDGHQKFFVEFEGRGKLDEKTTSPFSERERVEDLPAAVIEMYNREIEGRQANVPNRSYRHDRYAIGGEKNNVGFDGRSALSNLRGKTYDQNTTILSR